MSIILSSQQPFSSGHFRDCYIHPHDATKCIKISRHRIDRVPDEPRKRFGTRHPDPNQREYDEYARHQRAGVPLEQYFPRLYGFVETDIGRGLCMEMMRGSDLFPPVSLLDLLSTKRVLEGLRPDVIVDEFSAFANYCVRHDIMASADELKNVGFVRDGSGYRLVAFDMKRRPNREAIPISSLSSFIRRRKIRRRFDRSLASLRDSLRLMGDL